jgi:hypothetical protein
LATNSDWLKRLSDAEVVLRSRARADTPGQLPLSERAA